MITNLPIFGSGTGSTTGSGSYGFGYSGSEFFLGFIYSLIVWYQTLRSQHYLFCFAVCMLR